MPISNANLLGAYLRDRRGRLDPAAFGFGGRRRTPGLRREEVAQRANISPTWYTWLEQGRGGAPSADVLERLCKGLQLSDVEREHLFHLGLGRAPQPRYHAAKAISPRLQRLLDTFEISPALIKTATWDVIAWNRAASIVLTNFGQTPLEERNILRRMFGGSHMGLAQQDWAAVARFVVGAFRADTARAGASTASAAMIDELCQTSPEFEALWRENDVTYHGEGTKRITHPHLGLVELEFSSFAVDGRPDLSMIVYNPVSPGTAAGIRRLAASSAA